MEKRELQRAFTEAQLAAEQALRHHKSCIKQSKCSGGICEGCPVAKDAREKKRIFNRLRADIARRNETIFAEAEQRLVKRMQKADEAVVSLTVQRQTPVLTLEFYNEQRLLGKNATQIAEMLGVNPSNVTKRKKRWLADGLHVEGENKNEVEKTQ